MTQNDIMLELLRAAVLNSAPSVRSTAYIDWDELMDVASKQGVLAWVWEGVLQLPTAQQPDRLHKINWGLSAQEIWDTYEVHKNVLQQMIHLCDRHNIKLLVFKGISLSELYLHPHSRPSGDIDIYLFDDFEKGNQLLADGTVDITPKRAGFDFKGVHIENHRRFFPTLYRKYDLIDNYIKSTMQNVVLTTAGYYQLSPVSDIVLNMVHALTHMVNPDDPLRLRSILDIAMLLRNNQSDQVVRECRSVIKQLELANSFDLIVRVCEWLIQCDFAMYYIGKVPQCDVERFKKLLFDSPKADSFADGRIRWSDIRLRRKRYKSLRWTNRYVMASRSERLHNHFISQLTLMYKLIFRKCFI